MHYLPRLACVLLIAALAPSQSVPSSLPFQGRLLLQSGRTVNTAKSITFRIYNSAIGGSTNCPPHLIAIARHAGVALGLEDWQDIGKEA